MKTPCDESLVLSSGNASSRVKAKQPWILAATILGSSMAFVDSTVVNVAVPALETFFHANLVDVQWVVESYGILLSALILAGGALGDSFGRRRMFMIGVAVFTIASTACGLAQNIHQLILARCLPGLGAALLVPGSLAIISASFDEDSRGRAIGVWSGFTAITSAFGPVLGGWLIQYASWRWAFFLNLPAASVVLAISSFSVPESRAPDAKRVDWAGAALATVGLGGLITGFLESGRLGWMHPLVLAGLLGGCALLAIFSRVETKVPSPMVPFTLFRSRPFLGANILTLLLYGALGIFFFLFPMALIQGGGYSPTAAGSALLPMILLMFFLSRWAGGLVKSFGGKSSARRWASHRRRRLLFICCLELWRELLAYLFSGVPARRTWNGDHRRPAHDSGHELGHSATRWSCIRNQQCGGSRRGGARYRSLRNGIGPCL